MAHTNRITFFDLQNASDCTTSPVVWATKYALKHKGFDLDVPTSTARETAHITGKAVKDNTTHA